MPLFRDQLNRVVNLPSVPKRIISVVPSQTELLFYLGLDNEVIGITKFCIHPGEKFKSVTKVGGTKQLNIDLIRSLGPDLIIANKEENERSQVEELAEICPVWISDINNLGGALDMISSVGVLLDRAGQANDLCRNITNGFNKLLFPPVNLSVAYFIWRKPYMVAGPETYINSLLEKCGLSNAFDTKRYPEITADELTKINPDIIFLSSEPYPFAQKHIDEFKRLLPRAKVMLVDGEMFSWYGSRLLFVPDYLKELMEIIN
jgi:ABC-type Fe3+-hydroxamate transport system substrate-binding protein